VTGGDTNHYTIEDMTQYVPENKFVIDDDFDSHNEQAFKKLESKLLCSDRFQDIC